MIPTIPKETGIQELEEIYRRGLRQLEQGDWQQAIDSFLAVLRLDADYEEAVAMLKEAQKQKKLEALYKQGESFLSQKAWQHAIRAFAEILDIDPSHVEANKGLEESKLQERLRILYEQSKEHFSNREWQKAINNLEEVHNQDPSYDGVADLLEEAREQKRLQDLYDRGMECVRQGKWQTAVEIFEELRQAAPNYMDVDIRVEEAKIERQKQLNLLSLYSKAKEYEDIRGWDKAIDTYVKILAIDPSYEDVADRLAEVQRCRQSPPKAEEGRSQRFPSVGWWNALTPDGKAQVILGVLALIVAIYSIFGIPFASRWWSKANSGTSTVASTEILVLTNTPSFTPTDTVIPASTSLPTDTPTDTPIPTSMPTSTPYPAPTLVSPDKGTTLPKGQDVKLVWEWERDLAENEFFEVRIRLNGEREFDKMDLTTMSYQFVPASKLIQGRTYEWQVAVVSLAGEEKGTSQIWSFEVR